MVGIREHQASFQLESNNFKVKLDQFSCLYACCFTGWSSDKRCWKSGSWRKRRRPFEKRVQQKRKRNAWKHSDKRCFYFSCVVFSGAVETEHILTYCVEVKMLCHKQINEEAKMHSRSDINVNSAML